MLCELVIMEVAELDPEEAEVDTREESDDEEVAPMVEEVRLEDGEIEDDE